MTPHDHNRTLALIYGLLGALFTIPILVSPLLISRHVDDFPSPRRDKQILIAALAFCAVLSIALLLLLIAYGLHKRKRWARITALIIAAILVLYFPLGTALGVYTWWFLHSKGGRQLYSDPSEGNAT
jgi:MFS family permease